MTRCHNGGALSETITLCVLLLRGKWRCMLNRATKLRENVAKRNSLR
jgi:hypothetical protein